MRQGQASISRLAASLHDAGCPFAQEMPMAIKSVRKVRPIKQEPEAAAQPLPPEIADDQLRQRIAEAAYYRAQQRGFSPGYELEDWLAAEAQIRNAASVGG
jgi:hypothetical protein